MQMRTVASCSLLVEHTARLGDSVVTESPPDSFAVCLGRRPVAHSYPDWPKHPSESTLPLTRVFDNIESTVCQWLSTRRTGTANDPRFLRWSRPYATCNARSSCDPRPS